MQDFVHLPPFTDDGDVLVVVETPRGSRAKFAYDPGLRSFILSKSLLTGLSYPHDWGFVPSTNVAAQAGALGPTLVSPVMAGETRGIRGDEHSESYLNALRSKKAACR